MYKDKAIHNMIEIEDLKEKLTDICKETYYLFISGFNTGLKLEQLVKLRKKDLLEFKKSKDNQAIESNFWKEIQAYMEDFTDQDYIFPKQNIEAAANKEDLCSLLINTANNIGIYDFGNESLSKTYGYFHYQKFQDIEKLRKRFGLISPTATLHYLGYRDDSQICFNCNIGCLWKIK